MISLIRYSWSDTLRSQRWISPLFVVLAFTAIVSGTTGSILPSYTAEAALFLFIATWLAVIFSNSEDPIQFTVTSSASGSAIKARTSKLVAAYGFTLLLGCVGIAGPSIASPLDFRPVDLLIGGVEIAVTALVGVAIGSLCSRPIIRRTAWAFLLAVFANLVFVTVPHFPPTGQFVALFSISHPQHVPTSMLLTAAEAIGLAAVFLVASIELSKRRA